MASGPGHAYLVRDLELDDRHFASHGRFCACLAMFEALRSLILGLSWSAPKAFGLLAGMSNLTRLELLTSSLDYLSLDSRTLELLDSAAANLETLEIRTTGRFVPQLLERLPSYERAVSVIASLSFPCDHLRYADALFRSPRFRPASVSIGLDRDRDWQPLRLHPLLASLRGLEELELRAGATSVLLGAALPPAKRLVINVFKATVDEHQCAALEVLLQGLYGAVDVMRLRLRRGATCPHDAAEAAMWRRLTGGRLTTFRC